MTGLAAYRHRGGALLAASAVLALAAPAAQAESLVGTYRAALTKQVRDTELGVRATVRYFADVWQPQMWHETLDTGEDVEVFGGEEEGRFEAEITLGALDQWAAEAFLREAVMVVCPSADRAVVEAARVEIDGLHLRLTARCPEIDSKVRK